MIGQTIAHFRIIEKLGEGGMGVVYKAEDTKLGRTVALKFLPERTAGSDADRARFLQEARTAASLNHPNVCSVLDILESEGRDFIVMEFVEGATLRSRIHGGGLSAGDAVRLAVQIGEALEEAHGRGIVHRDVKSENIMLTARGQAKVMDFGLAKLKGAARQTKTLSTTGTLAYLSPEQLQGSAADARSDMFAFGVVLYEMLTSRLPFRGEHEAAIMYSIVNEDPPFPSSLRADLPPELDRIVLRLLAKNPAERYEEMGRVVDELRETGIATPERRSSGTQPVYSGAAASGDRTPTPRPTPRPPTPSPAAAVPVPASPAGKTKFRIPLIAAGALALAAAAYFIVPMFRSGPAPVASDKKTIAVLPFENLGTPEQEYFADGVTQEITSRLSGLSGLKVIARTSAMQYKKTTKTLAQVGEELGVQYVVQGTVRWDEQGAERRVRVNPELIQIADGSQLWSEPVEAAFSSAFTIQSDIASRVASALGLTLGSGERKALEQAPTRNAEAYDLYLQALTFLERMADREAWMSAAGLLERAVVLEPDFAAAHAILSRLHSAVYWFYYDRSPGRAAASLRSAEAAARLAPDASLTHAAFGWYHYHIRRSYDEAIGEFEKALKADPNSALACYGIAAVRRRQGRMQEAAEYFRKALDLDPRSQNLASQYAETCQLVRDYDNALRLIDQAIRLDPSAPEFRNRKVSILISAGDLAGARKAYEEGVRVAPGNVDNDRWDAGFVVRAYSGDLEGALRRIREIDWTDGQSQFDYEPRQLREAEMLRMMGRDAEAAARYDSARVIMEELVRRDPSDGRYRSALALALAGLGRSDAAVREARKAVEVSPPEFDAWIGSCRVGDLARVYTITGRHDEAVEELRRVLNGPSEFSKASIRLDPTWTPLRSNPKFRALVGEGPA
jgi:serine/threonine protein kinase/tetratricopeptide (TPR) repeat protein